MCQRMTGVLLLPLMILLPAPINSAGADLPPRDPTSGDLRRIVSSLVRRVRAMSRVFVPHTASEMHVIAAAATAEAKSTRPLSRRRRAAGLSTVRTLPSSPRVRPQTT